MKDISTGTDQYGRPLYARGHLELKENVLGQDVLVPLDGAGRVGPIREVPRLLIFRERYFLRVDAHVNHDTTVHTYEEIMSYAVIGDDRSVAK